MKKKAEMNLKIDMNYIRNSWSLKACHLMTKKLDDKLIANLTWLYSSSLMLSWLAKLHFWQAWRNVSTVLHGIIFYASFNIPTALLHFSYLWSNIISFLHHPKKRKSFCLFANERCPLIHWIILIFWKTRNVIVHFNWCKSLFRTML